MLAGEKSVGWDDESTSPLFLQDQSHNQVQCHLYDYLLMTNPHTPVLTEQEQLAHGCSGKSSCGSGFGVHKVQLCSGGAYGSLSRGVSLPSCGKSVPLQCTRRHFHAGWRLEQKDLSQENQYVQSCSEGFLNIKEHNKVLLFSGQLFKPWRKQQY